LVPLYSYNLVFVFLVWWFWYEWSRLKALFILSPFFDFLLCLLTLPSRSTSDLGFSSESFNFNFVSFSKIARASRTSSSTLWPRHLSPSPFPDYFVFDGFLQNVATLFEVIAEPSNVHLHHLEDSFYSYLLFLSSDSSFDIFCPLSPSSVFFSFFHLSFFRPLSSPLTLFFFLNVWIKDRNSGHSRSDQVLRRCRGPHQAPPRPDPPEDRRSLFLFFLTLSSS